MSEQIETVNTLVERWEAACRRTFLARTIGHGELTAEDYWAELRLGTRIARDVLAGRWCAVADLVRSGEVESWAQVGDALGVTETEARDGFARWLAGQGDLYRRTGLGVSPAEADELTALAEAVIW